MSFLHFKALAKENELGISFSRIEGGWIISSSKDEGKVSFSISLKYHSFKYLCDKRFNRLRFGVLAFQKSIEDLNGPAHQKEEKERERNPLERRKWCSKPLKTTLTILL